MTGMILGEFFMQFEESFGGKGLHLIGKLIVSGNYGIIVKEELCQFFRLIIEKKDVGIVVSS